jgi:hypothetical protein
MIFSPSRITRFSMTDSIASVSVRDHYDARGDVHTVRTKRVQPMTTQPDRTHDMGMQQKRQQQQGCSLRR